MIPIVQWSRDHWGVLAYAETCAVDNAGVISRERMRNDPDIHPGLTNTANVAFPAARYPTRLKGGVLQPAHDDWSCLEDCEAAGFISINGTGINPVVTFTDLGLTVAAALRLHKAKGGSFLTFEVVP